MEIRLSGMNLEQRMHAEVGLRPQLMRTSASNNPVSSERHYIGISAEEMDLKRGSRSDAAMQRSDRAKDL